MSVTVNSNNNINNIRINKGSREVQNKSFKGAAALSGLRFLNESPAIGACAVDLASMVVPRTVVETKNRGPQSGFETFFREVGSCLIHACVGLIGLGAATLVSGKFNEKYGVKAQNIFTGQDTINNMHSVWQNAKGGKKEFFAKFTEGLEGLNGSDMRKITPNVRNEVIDNLMTIAEKSKAAETLHGAEKTKLKKEVDLLKDTVIGKIVKNTGAKSSFTLKSSEKGVKEITSSLPEMIDNAVTLANTFSEKSSDKLSGFVKALSKNKTASTLLGIGICSAICMTIQPINRYLTKKRTGNDGFVGLQGEKKQDNSKEFKRRKTLWGIGFPAFAIATIGNPKNLVNNIQFKSKIPTLNQFKIIYGLTIGSRFLAARDDNELREGVIKDTMGFTNWLIFGSMVSKLTARAIGGKEIINTTVKQPANGKKGLKYAAEWLAKSSVKSYDEVLLPAAEKITKDGKMMKFSELVKNADAATKSKLGKIAFSQAAGYLYSGLVLGIGISKLNIAITKRVQSKKNAQRTFSKDINSFGIDKDHLKKLKNEANPVFKDFN